MSSTARRCTSLLLATTLSGCGLGEMRLHPSGVESAASAPLRAPARMDTPLPGALQFTWDGRVMLSMGMLDPQRANLETENGRLARQYNLNTGWGLSVFRPEALEELSATADLMKQPGVFSAATELGQYPLEYNLPLDSPTVTLIGAAELLRITKRTTNMDLHNIAAIVPDPTYVENPFRSDGDGNPDANGAFSTYQLYLYTNRWVSRNVIPAGALAAGEEWVAGIGLRSGRIIVADAGKKSARIHSARMHSVENDGRDGRFKPLRDAAGNFLFRDDDYAIEPTATFDGHLVIYQGYGGTLKYTYNPVISDRGWSAPREVTSMPFDPRLRARYPIAARQWLRGDGTPYADGAPYRGAYPWLSLDGSELFHAASFVRNPPPASLPGGQVRGAATVIGKWTGWAAKHVDGTLNPDREAQGANHSSQRVFMFSIGAVPGTWSPYVDPLLQKLPIVPQAGPFYPLFDQQMAQYHEVSFEDFTDGEYLAFYRMNELVTSTAPGSVSSAYVTNRTPDTSGNFNTGVMTGDAKFPADLAPGNAAYDLNPGINGRAIFFGRSGLIVAQPPQGRPNSLVHSGRALTLQLWIKRLPGSLAIDRAQNLLCFDCELPATLNHQLSLETSGVIALRALVGGALSVSTTPTPVPADDQWHHVAAVIDGTRGLVSLYLDGALSLATPVAPGDVIARRGNLFIGPAGQPAEPPGLGVGIFMLDEVAISRVARSRDEVLAAAYRSVRSPRVTERIALPPGLRPQELQIPAGRAPAAAELELGRLLFHDPELSSTGAVSCATCHQPQLGFTDGRALARGLSGQSLKRNTPTVVNRAFSSAQFFDGRATTLEEQAIAPIVHPDEMGGSVAAAVTFLSSVPGYVTRFQAAYGALPSESGIKNALASFQRSLLSGGSKADRYEGGQLAALDARELRGRSLFRGKARCVGCHSGSNFTDERFHRTGLADNGDTGRMQHTGRLKDRAAFKTPTLRDVSKTAPYFHDGSAADLEAVVRRYNDGASGQVGLESMVVPLGLTDTEVGDVVAFLRALDGDPTWVDATVPVLPGDRATLTVGSCQVASGQSTCPVRVQFQARAAASAGVRVRLAGAPLSASTAVCGGGSPCDAPLPVGSYLATLHQDGSQASSAVLRTVPFDVTSAPVTPVNELVATGCQIAQGQGGCTVQLRWSTAAQGAALWARVAGSGAAPLAVCTTAAERPVCAVPAVPAGTYEVTMLQGATVLTSTTVTVTPPGAAGPTGSLSAAGCTIPSGAQGCNVTLSGTVSNAPGAGVRVRALGAAMSASVQVCLGSMSSCALPTSVAGTFTLTLHVDGQNPSSMILASRDVTVTQGSAPTQPTGALTAAGCTISFGASSCAAQVSATVANAPVAGIRARLASQPVTQSVTVCGALSCAVPTSQPGSYVVTLHTNGQDPASAILDSKTVFIAANANRPAGAVTQADAALLAGWAADADNAAAAVNFAVIVNREATPRHLAAASVQRADVGAHGFSIANPIQALGLASGPTHLAIFIEDVDSNGASVGMPQLLWQVDVVVP